jgi:hypothetical protein
MKPGSPNQALEPTASASSPILRIQALTELKAFIGLVTATKMNVV